MNLIKRLIAAFVIAILLTAAATEFLPAVRFSSYVPIVLKLGFVSTLALAGISMYREEDLNMHDKNLLMNGMLVSILVPSLFAAGAFMHESQTSWSGGEIHWHADFEVIVDGERADLIDPSNFCEGAIMCSLNDRTGITKYHEHNDNRIHLEGTFKTRDEATLGAFFETFGGKLTPTKLVMPTDKGWINKTATEQKSVKIIVNRGVAGNRQWEIIEYPGKYVISPYKRGPSLDDVFIIYDETSPQQALEDLKDDDKYRGMGLMKSGDGF